MRHRRVTDYLPLALAVALLVTTLLLLAHGSGSAPGAVGFGGSWGAR
jgi:hypothetical protein